MKKLLITQFVSGKYAGYVPFFKFFLEKAYPGYDCLIVNMDKFSHDPDVVKTMRWCFIPTEYNDYEYIYIGDVDILIMREDPPLLEQHIEIMKKYGTCYSNTDKLDPVETRGHRMTGLHCFKRDEYLAAMSKYITLGHYVLINDRGKDMFYNDPLQKFDNQHALYRLIKESVLKMPEHSFFSYHGLHLGHSRVPGRWETLFAEDEQHRGWYRSFAEILDSTFWNLFNEASDEIKEEMTTMIREGEKICWI